MKEKKNRKTIAYVAPFIWGDISLTYFRGVLDTLKEGDSNIVFYIGNRLEDSKDFSYQGNLVYRLMSEEWIDGILMWASQIAETLPVSERRKIANRFPKVPMVTIAGSVDEADAVYGDDRIGIELLIEHLHKKHQCSKFHMMQEEFCDFFEDFSEVLGKDFGEKWLQAFFTDLEVRDGNLFIGQLKDALLTLKRTDMDLQIFQNAISYLRSHLLFLMQSKSLRLHAESIWNDFILSSTLIDNLTNLYIRNVFTVVLEKEMELSKRELLPLSILLMDVDDFKDINDTYGHAEGDRVLRQIGNIINLSIRSMDFAARYGGEELIVIMPNTSMKFAIKVGNLIRERISSYRFGDYKITVSGGVSQMGIKIKEGEELIKQADQALYLAKSLGKDKIIGFFL